MNNKYKFLVFNSKKIQIIQDSCLKGLQSLKVHSIYSSIKYIDYSSINCDSNKYVLVIKNIERIENFKIDLGNDIKQLSCSSFSLMLYSKNIEINIAKPKLNSNYANYLHIRFNAFKLIKRYSPLKEYSSTSTFPLLFGTSFKFHYCFIKGYVKVYGLYQKNFRLRTDRFIQISNIPAIVYFKYIAKNKQLDCLISILN